MGAIWLLDTCTHTRVVAGIGALSSPDQIGEKEKSGCHAAPGQDSSFLQIKRRKPNSITGSGWKFDNAGVEIKRLTQTAENVPPGQWGGQRWVIPRISWSRFLQFLFCGRDNFSTSLRVRADRTGWLDNSRIWFCRSGTKQQLPNWESDWWHLIGCMSMKCVERNWRLKTDHPTNWEQLRKVRGRHYCRWWRDTGGNKWNSDLPQMPQQDIKVISMMRTAGVEKFQREKIKTYKILIHIIKTQLVFMQSFNLISIWFPAHV